MSHPPACAQSRGLRLAKCTSYGENRRRCRGGSERVELFEIFPWAAWVFAGLLGLVVGSFLNVAAYRVPIMLERAWRAQCRELEAASPAEPLPAGEAFNLWTPRSACPSCGAAVAPRHNVPVLGYLLLRGRCARCRARISPRYPVVEAVAGVLALVVVWVFGPTWQALVALPLTWTLLVLAVIDIDHQLLPDSMTLPLMWAGLLLSLVAVDGGVLLTDVRSSLIGAAAGYLALWSVHQIFRLITGQAGMGYGDFKLAAALGAWLGWQVLPLVVLLAAAGGAAAGIAGVVLFGRPRRRPIPFGPYLAAAGWVGLLWGEPLMTHYGQWLA